MSSKTLRRASVLGVAGSLMLLSLTGGTAGVTAKGRKPPATGPGTVVHKQDGRRVQGKALKGLDVPRPALYDIGKDAAEPTIAIDSKGNIFVAASDLDADVQALNPGNQVDIVRSTNEGRTWNVVSPRVGPVKSHPITLDPYVWMDEYTDRVYTIDLTVACSIMSWSDDLGTSWLTNPASCGRPVNDHQTLFGGPPAISTTVGYDSVLYYCWNDIATSSCGKSLNGGITWNPTGSPAFLGGRQGSDQSGRPDVCGGLHGHGVVGPDGTVFLPREYCAEPYVAISHDEGATWEQIKVANQTAVEGSDPSVAVDAKGNVYYVWTGKARLPYLAVSRDGGQTWSKPMNISHPKVNESNFVTVDAGDPGKIAVAYYGAENSPGKPAWQSRDPQKAQRAAQKYIKTTWNIYMMVSDNVFADDPIFYSAVINDPDDPLVRGRCGPGRCGRVFDFIDVEIAPDGTAWAPVVDACIADEDPTAPGWNCANKPLGAQNYGDAGLVARLMGGPSLR